MQPEVRYCTAVDGVRIAYNVTGDGSPLVIIGEFLSSHAQLEWKHPVIGRLLDALAAHHTVIKLDLRGSGLSDRIYAATPEGYVPDLEAVVERLQLREFSMAAVQSGSLAAIAFASRHPEQLHRLVREESRVHGAHIRSCVNPDFLDRADLDADASPLLESVTMPTLVLHHPAVRLVTEEMTRQLASRIPDARLVTLDGMWADDPEDVARRISAFVDEDKEHPHIKTARLPSSGVHTMLFTDLVGHTEMMRRLGDARGREVLREHERLTREAIKTHHGKEIKTDGDSFMVSFGSVASAMECAIDMQRTFAMRNQTDAEPLRVRMGLNAGEPIEEDGDLFGESVILASRIAAKAGAGDILVPDTVRGLLSGKGFVFSDRGEFVPKGFDEGVRLWEVRWQK